MKTLTSEDLHDDMETVLDNATREPTTITRQDEKPALVIISKTLFNSMMEELAMFIR